MVEIKSDVELDAMREAGRVVANALAAVRNEAAVGVSLADPRRPQPVNELVGDRILFTVLLSLGTILFTWSIALPIRPSDASTSARRRSRGANSTP